MTRGSRKHITGESVKLSQKPDFSFIDMKHFGIACRKLRAYFRKKRAKESIRISQFMRTVKCIFRYDHKTAVKTRCIYFLSSLIMKTNFMSTCKLGCIHCLLKVYMSYLEQK